jgi:hypothetical protein
MKILLFASARVAVVNHAIRTYCDGNDMTVLAPRPAHNALEYPENRDVLVVKLNANGFYNIADSELSEVVKRKYDIAVVVSGGLGFLNFNNVIAVLSKFSVNELIFFNSVDQETRYAMPNRTTRRVQKYIVITIYNIYKILHKIKQK